jgi:hypothetical protein
MRYTKYLALVATLSILSVSTLASAATGAIVPLANTTLSSTGMMAPASLEVK